MAVGLPDNIRSAGLAREHDGAPRWNAPQGSCVILAGSCSAATRQQIRNALDNGIESLKVDPRSLENPDEAAKDVMAWAKPRLGDRPILVYSSAEPKEVQEAQAELGTTVAGERVEHCLAATARLLVEAGARRIIVAGGETSGAVVEALGAIDLAIGPEIDPGVPWMLSERPVPVVLALKSGNFGSPDFFLKAWSHL